MPATQAVALPTVVHVGPDHPVVDITPGGRRRQAQGWQLAGSHVICRLGWPLEPGDGCASGIELQDPADWPLP